MVSYYESMKAMRWKDLWLLYHVKTEWVKINMGFWVSMMVVVILMNAVLLLKTA